MTTPMKHLSELLERLEASEIAYKTAKTSLDNSLEYIVCREELKQARFIYGQECMRVISSLLDDSEAMSESKLIGWYYQELV